MQRRTSGRGLAGLSWAVAAVAAFGTSEARGQTTYTFSTTATSTAWLNSNNWTGNTGHFAGADANASSTADGATTDIATFTTIAISGTTPSLGINLNTNANTGVGNNTGAAGLLQIGAINFLGSKDLIIGSSTSAGLLRLNGATIDPGSGSLSNVILAIPDAATKNLTIQPTQANGGTLGVQLGNAASTIYVTTGRTLTITSIISELNTGSAVTIQGGGTTVFGGVNTYTGATTVSSGTLVLNPGGSLAAGSAVSVTGGTFAGAGTPATPAVVNGPLTVNTGGTVRGGTGTALGNLTLAAGATVNGGATLASAFTVSGGAIGTNSNLLNGGTFNLVSTGGAYNIQLVTDSVLTAGTQYTLTIANGGNYQKNGTAYDATTNPYIQGVDFNVVSGSGNYTYAGAMLSGANNSLQLTFTPVAAAVPEPTTVLGLGALGLGAMRWVRRKRRKRR